MAKKACDISIKARPGDVILYSDRAMLILAVEPKAEFASDGKLLSGGFHAQQITFEAMTERLRKGHQLIERRNENE